MRRIVSWVLFFLIGLAIGFAMRPRVPFFTEGDSTETYVQAVSPNDIEGNHSPKTNETKRERNISHPHSELTFTLKQWRELQKGRASLQIPLDECIHWSRQVFRPIANGDEEDVGEDITVEGGLDLAALVNFLGLDEIQTTALAAALKRYGQAIRDAEIRNATPIYHGNGKLEIQMSDGGVAKDKAYRMFCDECLGFLGEKQFRRLEAVALAKVFSGQSPLIEVSVLRDFINLFHPQGHYFFSLKEVKGREVQYLSEMVGSRNRLDHLDFQVDWARLYSEALEGRKSE
jgi:hypothetical protein